MKKIITDSSIAKREKPFISVVISIYNREHTLQRCLDSLVYQTLDNIEIICVNKESTDKSGEILEKYKNLFPRKVKVLNRPYTPSPASGWRWGFEAASSDYITVSDTDDYFELCAFEKIYNHIKENNPDIVLFKSKIITEDEIRIDSYPEPITVEETVKGSWCCAYWNKVFKKCIINNNGGVPEMLYSDLGFWPIVFSNSPKITCIPEVFYTAVQIGGLSYNKNSGSQIQVIEAMENIILKSNPRYRKEIFYFVAVRINGAMENGNRYTDDFIQFFQKYADDFLNNSVLLERKNLYTKISNYINNYKTWIPKIIYVNGFVNISQERLEYLQKKSFNFGSGEVVVLNKENCKVSGDVFAEEMLRQKNYKALGYYFALKNIYENGGGYIGEKIEITLSLNYFRQFQSFFSPKNFEEISSQIFGAQARSNIVKYILDAYSFDMGKSSLNEIIEEALLILYDYHYNGDSFYCRDFAISDITETVVNTGNQQNMCVHNFCDLKDNINYVVIDRNLLQGLCITPPNLRSLSTQNRQLRMELKKIKNSDTYKLANRFKKLANTKLCYPFKKLFKWFLRVYRRKKYGM